MQPLGDPQPELVGRGAAVRVEAISATCDALEDTPRRCEQAFYLPSELREPKISPEQLTLAD